MTEPITRPPYTPGHLETRRPAPDQPGTDPVVLQHLVALRGQVDNAYKYSRSAYRWAVAAFLVALVAAITSTYSAYVIYSILHALRDATNGVN